MKTKLGPTHLVIGDVHVEPGQDFRRLDWLGQIIVDDKPDVIICMGDFGDMPSLCSYDRGKKGFEGRRYRKDIESVHAAMERLLAPLREYNAKQKREHRKQYIPRMIMIMGNHEHRVDKAPEFDAILEGTISTADLKYKEFGWEVIPFLEEVEIDGVTYMHYFPSGVMARPIGGEHPATMLLNKQHKSCTAGHLHLADWATRRAAGGTHIMGCMAGCYFEHDLEYQPASVNRMFWRGVIFKHNVVDGAYDIHMLSLNTIKRRFGINKGE